MRDADPHSLGEGFHLTERQAPNLASVDLLHEFELQPSFAGEACQGNALTHADLA
jgi:hypothetical protein